MIPVFVAVFYVSDETLSLHHKHLLSTFIFWLAPITDWLDGYLARPWIKVRLLALFSIRWPTS